jgi:hypothetical protein
VKNKDFIQCILCKENVKDPQLLHFKNGFPCNVCKKCILQDISNNEYNENIVKKWCKEFDIPFVPEIWETLMYLSNPKIPYYNLFLEYLALMKLPACIKIGYEEYEKSKENKNEE